jgi:hypothetical protein
VDEERRISHRKCGNFPQLPGGAEVAWVFLHPAAFCWDSPAFSSGRKPVGSTGVTDRKVEYVLEVVVYEPDRRAQSEPFIEGFHALYVGQGPVETATVSVSGHVGKDRPAAANRSGSLCNQRLIRSISATQSPDNRHSKKAPNSRSIVSVRCPNWTIRPSPRNRLPFSDRERRQPIVDKRLPTVEHNRSKRHPITTALGWMPLMAMASAGLGFDGLGGNLCCLDFAAQPASDVQNEGDVPKHLLHLGFRDHTRAIGDGVQHLDLGSVGRTMAATGLCLGEGHDRFLSVIGWVERSDEKATVVPLIAARPGLSASD